MISEHTGKREPIADALEAACGGPSIHETASTVFAQATIPTMASVLF